MKSEEQPKIYTTINKERKTYFTQKQVGKENTPNTLEYKLKELNDSKNNKDYRNNITYFNNSNNNDSITNNNNINNVSQNNNSNLNTILMNSQLTNKTYQSNYSRHKQNTQSNNISTKTVNNQINLDMNNVSNNNNNNKKGSKQKYQVTAQIDEQHEMQKLLDLEKKNYINKFKDNAYKTVRDMNASSSSNNISNSNINTEVVKNRKSMKSGSNVINSCLINKDSGLDKNIKNYIDEKAEQLKEFFHEEINNLHCDLIKQFEIQNSQNMKLLQEFSILNKQMAEEIKRLKSENELLKGNAA